MLDFVLFNENVTACIIAHEQDSIKKLFRIVRRAYEYLDPFFRPELDRGGGSKYEMFFPAKNSRIYCDLESRSDTINWLHVSEAAFIDEEDRLKATLQAVPIETGIVQIESTPNGLGNFFHEMWKDPEQPYTKLFFPWFVFAPYQLESFDSHLTEDERELIKKAKKYGVSITNNQIAFRRYKQRELGALFPQEYPEDDAACFLASGASAIDSFKIRDQIQEITKPIKTTNQLKIFKPYDKSRHYVCGVDCSEGVDGDYSVATLFDASSREQIAILRGRIKPHQFAKDVFDLCEVYTGPGDRWPLLAIERNNHGHAVLLELDHHLKYSNLFIHKDGRVGWLTDRVTRPIMLDMFIDGLENKNIKINDPTTLDECMTLVNDDGKIQAASGKHDDCVIAAAIAIQMCVECSTLEIYDNIKSKILL